MSDVDPGTGDQQPSSPVPPAVPRRRSALPRPTDVPPSRPATRAVRPPETASVAEVSPPEVLVPAGEVPGAARLVPGARRHVGPWCFVEHRTGDDGDGPVPDIAAHPHTGLQLVTWVFAAAVEHRTSVAPNAVVHAGELSLLTAGRGASHGHADVSDGGRARAVRLAALLPADALDVPPTLEHHSELPVLAEGGVRLTVAMGTVCGITSPARTYRPLACAQLELAAGVHIALPVDRAFEHGILVDDGTITVEGTSAGASEIVVLPSGRSSVRLSVGDAPTRLLIVGGPPCDDETIVWWGLAAPDHAGVAAARADWAAQRTRRARGADPTARFGRVDDGAAPAAAPELAGVRLRVPAPRGPRPRV